MILAGSRQRLSWVEPGNGSVLPNFHGPLLTFRHALLWNRYSEVVGDHKIFDQCYGSSRRKAVMYVLPVLSSSRESA